MYDQSSCTVFVISHVLQAHVQYRWTIVGAAVGATAALCRYALELRIYKELTHLSTVFISVNETYLEIVRAISLFQDTVLRQTTDDIVRALAESTRRNFPNKSRNLG